MKKIILLVVLISLLSLVSCGKNDSAEKNTDSNSMPKSEDTNSISKSEDLESVGERYIEEEGGYSICPPKSWEITDFPGFENKMFVEKVSKDTFAPNMNFIIEEYEMSIDEYAEAGIESIKKLLTDAEIGEPESIKTISGLDGIKVVSKSNQYDYDLRQTTYFLPSEGKKKIVITCSVLDEFGDDYVKEFDDSVSTFEWIK